MKIRGYYEINTGILKLKLNKDWHLRQQMYEFKRMIKTPYLVIQPNGINPIHGNIIGVSYYLEEKMSSQFYADFNMRDVPKFIREMTYIDLD